MPEALISDSRCHIGKVKGANVLAKHRELIHLILVLAFYLWGKSTGLSPKDQIAILNIRSIVVKLFTGVF